MSRLDRSQYQVVKLPVCDTYHPAKFLINEDSYKLDDGIINWEFLGQFGNALANAHRYHANSDDREEKSGRT
jgi:hypothetical protein